MINEYTPEEILREQRAQKMLQRYRNVFGTTEGRRVLGDILTTCHFGVPLNNEVERVEYNVGIAIARMSGIMSAIEHQLGMGIEED